MPLGIRRLAACLAAVFAMLLAGCDVSGHIELRSRDQVVVDLVVTQDSDDAGCALGALNMGGRLTVVQRLDVNGVRTCHVQGTVHPEQLRPYLHVSHVGEYVTVSFNPFSRAPDSSQDREQWFGVLDVTVQAPGTVLATTGEADGTRARFRDSKQLNRPYGLTVEALDHPGPAWAVAGPIAGFLGGAATVVALVLWRRRRTAAARPSPRPMRQPNLTSVPGPQVAGTTPPQVCKSSSRAMSGLARSGQPRRASGPNPPTRRSRPLTMPSRLPVRDRTTPSGHRRVTDLARARPGFAVVPGVTGDLAGVCPGRGGSAMSRSLPDGGKTYSVSGRYTTSARFPCIGRRCRDRRPGGLRTGGRPDPGAARDDAWRAEMTPGSPR